VAVDGRHREGVEGGAHGASRQAQEEAALAGKMDSVTGGQNRLPIVADRRAAEAGASGGSDPIDPRMAEIYALLMRARMMPSRPPRMPGQPGIPMSPETGQRLDVGRMASRLYGNEGD